jgi:hypothetical protein
VKETRTLRELFSLSGFYAQRQLQGMFGEPKTRVVELKRQKKELSVQDVVKATADITMLKFVKCEISMLWDGTFISVINNGG